MMRVYMKGMASSMFNKTEQRYLQTVLKEDERKLTVAITSCQERSNPDEKHIQRLEKKLAMNKKIAAKLEV